MKTYSQTKKTKKTTFKNPSRLQAAPTPKPWQKGPSFGDQNRFQAKFNPGQSRTQHKG